MKFFVLLYINSPVFEKQIKPAKNKERFSVVSLSSVNTSHRNFVAGFNLLSYFIFVALIFSFVALVVVKSVEEVKKRSLPLLACRRAAVRVTAPPSGFAWYDAPLCVMTSQVQGNRNPVFGVSR